MPVDVGKKYRNYFLQDVVMRKMEKVFRKVPQGKGEQFFLPLASGLGRARTLFTLMSCVWWSCTELAAVA